MKFVGLALAFPERDPAMFEYFLNHANHKAGIPLDMISYHFYATPTREQTAGNWQFTFFDQAERFIVATRFVEEIRKRLSPETRTTMDEIGSILPTDWHPDTPNDSGPAIPAVYWNASGALYAYLYMESAKMGIDVIGESQLVGYPSQFPSVTMVDWTTGKPNARFEVLRLIHDKLKPGDSMGKAGVAGGDVDALAFKDGTSARILLVNKRDRVVRVALPEEFSQWRMTAVNATHQAAANVQTGSGNDLTLEPFAVAVVESTR
jgi:hypothetical protein